MSTPMTPEALPAGLDGVLIRFALTTRPEAMAAAQLLAAQLDRAPPAGVTEIAPGLVSVLLRFDRARVARADLARAALSLARQIATDPPALPAPARRWTIPAAFGGDHGPQLDEVAGKLNLTPDQASRAICAQDLRVLAIGFAPGQAYIGLLPEAWNLPRMAELNPNVPAGAIVMAVRQLVIFGAPSATGWRQVAQTAFRTFDPGRAQPMLLRAGDAIRLQPVPPLELGLLHRAPDGTGGARLDILA